MSFTLAIPFHRLDSMLERSIVSVIDDLTQNDELLLINDSPYTNIIAEEFLASSLEKLKSTFSIVKTDTKGIVHARNVALTKARFDILSFLDSDDTWVTGRRARHLQLLRSNPSAPGVSSEIAYVCIHGRYLGRSRLAQRTLRRFLKTDLRFFPRIRTSSTSIRVASALKAGGFLKEESDCEDFGLWLRVQKYGIQLLIDQEVGARYTIHADQLSASIGTRANLRLRELTIMAIREAQKQSFSRFHQSIIASIENGGVVDWALTGSDCKTRQLFCDVSNPKLMLLTLFLILTAVVAPRRTCPDCSANA